MAPASPSTDEPDTCDPAEHLLPQPSPTRSPSPSLFSTQSPPPSPFLNKPQILHRLYLSHALSTWNSRIFEFGAVLFLATIFPGTLLYASVYALLRALASVVLAAWVGGMVDGVGRLAGVRGSIVCQRIPVALSCVLFLVLLSPDTQTYGPVLNMLLFAVVVVLACVEKLAASANTVAVERDWAIVVADALAIPRQDLNASMRRIDLFCKLVAPVVISVIDGLSTRLAIWVVLGVNVLSVGGEYFAIAMVYTAVPQLERRWDTDDEAQDGRAIPRSFSLQRCIRNAAAPWREYISSPVFLASFALSLLYLTVLSFGSTMVTYLLHAGFTPLQVSGMRIGAVAAEISGTWAAPYIMGKIGPIRSGLWFLNWQFGCLAAAVAAFAFYDNQSQLVAVSLIVGVALSRIGLWGFDLSVQFLVQEGVNEHARARFSSTEMALQSIFELLSFATTIAFPLPGQFKYPVYISYGGIGMAAVCFAMYVRKERGHLLHMSKCFGVDKKRIPLQEGVLHAA